MTNDRRLGELEEVEDDAAPGPPAEGPMLPGALDVAEFPVLETAEIDPGVRSACDPCCPLIPVGFEAHFSDSSLC